MQMTFEEAARDPRRPLSLTPREWMSSVEASLAEEEDLTANAAKRIAAEEKELTPDQIKDSGTGLEKIDMGLDQMEQGAKIVQSGLQEARLANLPPKARKAVETIRDLMDTAIEPYLVDIINASDSLEGEGR